MRKLLVLGFVLVVLAAGGGYWWQAQLPVRYAFRTAPVERGPFLAFIGATGTIEPVEVIDVGARVAGSIERFGIDPRCQKDLCLTGAADLCSRVFAPSAPLFSGLVPVKNIDYGSPVEIGTILAQLDDSLYRTEVDASRAELRLARAELQERHLRQEQAERDWNRARELLLTKSISSADFEAARLGFEVAQSLLDRGKANVAKAEASLSRAEINLNYTTIRSPAKGVIIDRRVAVGQTVVASLNAPSLFLLGTDLGKLQVWASVNEADIGQITKRQRVQFTVDAYPGEVFHGAVMEDQPRLNATMTQNVVTYTVVVDVDNADQRLAPRQLVARTNKKMLPYLTANVKFVLTEKPSALLVANAALRWRPQPKQVVPQARADFEKALNKRRSGEPTLKELARRTVWIERDGLVQPLSVEVGHSDGTVTEVIAGDLNEGDRLVFGEEVRGDNGSNPFGPPSMFGTKKKEP